MSLRSKANSWGRRFFYLLLLVLPAITGCKPRDNGGYADQRKLRRKLDNCGLLTEGKWQLFPNDPTVTCLLDCLAELKSCDQLRAVFCRAPSAEEVACYDRCVTDEPLPPLPTPLPEESNDDLACDEGSEADGCVAWASHTCDDSTQIPLQAVCNGRLDCNTHSSHPLAVRLYDVSDEEDCDPPQLFQCDDGQKTSIYFECNAVIECIDGSDEHEGCAYIKCE